MDLTLQIEDVFIQVKDKLQKDCVKLWLPPYYFENKGPSEDAIKVNNIKKKHYRTCNFSYAFQNLSLDYSRVLSLPYDSCYAAISELQTCALENLKQRNRYKESGVAAIKVKVLNIHSPPKMLTQECLLSTFGLDFKNSLGSSLNISSDRYVSLINSYK